MWWQQGNNFNDFFENQLNKFHALSILKAKIKLAPNWFYPVQANIRGVMLLKYLGGPGNVMA